MSLFLGDLRIKAALTLGLEDIAKNDWLIDDILGDTISNEYMRRFYGSQIASCKQWLLNNRVNIMLSEQQADKLEFPAITIEIGTIDEKMEMRHMGDLSTQSIKLLPNNINKPIPYVIRPTITGTYSPTTGVFVFNEMVDLNNVSPGMVLVDPINGVGYVIQGVTAANQINLLTGLTIPNVTFGIIPEYQYYDAKIGHAFMQESYRVGCHGMDQQTTLWLHSISMYLLLRYRQSLLEAQGGAESIIKSSKMYANADYSDAGQVIWTREINLSLQSESRWIAQPHRIIENIAIGNGNGYEGGIKIISNITDDFEDLNTVNWSTLRDIAYQDEE